MRVTTTSAKLHMRSKLKHHNYNLVSAYKPIQDVDPDTIMIRQTAINIPTLRRAFSHVLGRLEELLFKDVLFFCRQWNSSVKGFSAHMKSPVGDASCRTVPWQRMCLLRWTCSAPDVH